MVISFTIPDAVFPELLSALAVKYRYPETVVVDGASVPNPENKRAFVKRRIAEEWVEVLAEAQGRAAAAAASDAAKRDARRRIVIS